MREGLRSEKCKLDNGIVPAKPVVSRKRKSGNRDEAVVSDSRVERGSTLVSCGPCLSEKIEGKICGPESEGIEEGGNEKPTGDDAAERKIASVAKKKVKKEESSRSDVHICHRVLRSSSSRPARSVKDEDQDVSEKETAMESEETHEGMVDGVNKSNRKRNEDEKLKQNDFDMENDEPRKKPKGKRGRPKKVKESNGVSSGPGEKVKQNDSNMANDEPWKKLKGKRGRPKKVQESNGVSSGPDEKLKHNDSNMENDEPRKKLKGKRGRPKKVQESNGVSEPLKLKGSDADLRVKLGRRCKMRKNKLKPRISDGRLKNKKVKDGRGRPNKVQKIDEKLMGEKKLKDGRGWPKKVQKIDEKSMGDAKGDEVSPEKIPDKGDTEKGTVLKKGKRARSEVRQTVRDKIIEIVLSAGWSIQYRPRNGKEYLDSVYVNLQGRTHWSVTLAYNMLKQSYEEGNGESNYYTPGFQFIPIPDDEIGVLKKVMSKKRVGKKKLSPEERESLTNRNRVIREKNKQQKKAKAKVKKAQEKSVSNRDRDRKKMQNGKRRTLLVRNSMEEADSGEGGYTPYDGKRTVFAWMIDLETVSPDLKVQYFDQAKTRVLLEGRLAREGIHCDCCEKTLTVSGFEAHAGNGISGRFENMFLESGTSLSQCLLESWNKQPEAERSGFHHIDVLGDDPNDDTCGICGDGGDLICCDGCPSTFHQSCLDIQKFPSGDWHCVYCSCKNCGRAGRNECQDEDRDILAAPDLLSCQLCEEKYHLICTKENDAVDELFCGKKCSEISKNLEKLLGVKHDLDGGFSCTFLRRSDLDSRAELPKYDVAQKIECNSKLAVALSVMDECFLPMLDQRSGINLIRNIVYNFGSNIKRLSYNGFLTAILERDDEIISAASIRIHGFQLAEMPFIGTRYMYRRQGMCRRLLTGIESVLHSLGVERLVIPAISQLEETWTSVFGFKYLEVSEKEEIKSMNLVVFPGVQMLQKPTSTQISEEPMIVVEGPRNSELVEHPDEEEVLCEADEVCVKDCVPVIYSVAIEPCGDEIHEPVIEPDALDLHIHDNPDGKSGTVRTRPESICVCQDQSEEIGKCRNGSSKSIAPVIELTATEPCGNEVNEPAIEPDAPNSHIHDDTLDKTETPFSAELATACDNPCDKCEHQTVEITESTDLVNVLTAVALVSEGEDQPSALPCSESAALDNGEVAYDEAKELETHEPCKDTRNEPEASGLHIHDDTLDKTNAPSSAELGTAHDNPDGKSETIMNLPIPIHVCQGQTEEIGECRNASSESIAPEIVLTAVVSVSEQEDNISVSRRSKFKAHENGELDVSFERVSSNGDYSVHQREEKRPVSHDFPSNGRDNVQTSLTLGGIYSTPTEEKPESDSRGRHLLLDDHSFGSSHGVYLESNGHCILKEIIPCSHGVIVDNAKD